MQRPFIGKRCLDDSGNELDVAHLLLGHRRMLLIATSGIKRGIRFRITRLDHAVVYHPALHFLTADIRDHGAVDLDAGTEGLTALLFHLPAEGRILDDVLLFEVELVFAKNGAHALAPATVSLEISGDFWGRFHGKKGLSEKVTFQSRFQAQKSNRRRGSGHSTRYFFTLDSALAFAPSMMAVRSAGLL